MTGLLPVRQQPFFYAAYFILAQVPD